MVTDTSKEDVIIQLAHEMDGVGESFLKMSTLICELVGMHSKAARQRDALQFDISVLMGQRDVDREAIERLTRENIRLSRELQEARP